jgi:addiction module HigA family antidote
MDNVIVNAYQPDYVSPPGETLAEILEEQSMTQAELAVRVGYSQETIDDIIQAKSALTLEFALALEQVFETPAAFWNRREQLYRDYVARVREYKNLEQQACPDVGGVRR